MAAVTPSIITLEVRSLSNSNSAFYPAFTSHTPTAGALYAVIGIGRAAYQFTLDGSPNEIQGVDNWYSFEGSDQGDSDGWNLTDPWVAGNLSDGYFNHALFKIADGDESPARTLFKTYGYTSYGNTPRWWVALEITGFADIVDNPIRVPYPNPSLVSNTNNDYFVQATVAGTLTLNALPAATVVENSIEYILSWRTGSTGDTWTISDGTQIYNNSSSSDGGSRVKIHQRTIAADGSSPSVDMVVASGVVRARRVFIQGKESTPPQEVASEIVGVADFNGSLRNVSQERRNAAQAIDRRQHIWISDIHGERKVVLR